MIAGMLKRLLANALRGPSRAADPSSLSDNQDYPRFCLQASRDERVFADFRSHPVYNAILEHTRAEQGQQYLDIVARDADLLGAMDRFRLNDAYGNPRTSDYALAGKISPATLRYVKVLADLKSLFGPLDGLDLCEIGVGYGGQCRIISAYYHPATYCLVDIAPALALARRFLANYDLRPALSYRTMDELAPRDYDLIISNYAFTELRRPIQDEYLAKAILRSKKGYITYNEITPAGFDSYKADDLLRIIPRARRIAETPLTHPKNCVIAWG